ncbi:hypothetical protein QOT17_017814 [Balamuthia mandrillaris]
MRVVLGLFDCEYCSKATVAFSIAFVAVSVGLILHDFGFLDVASTRDRKWCPCGIEAQLPHEAARLSDM